MSPDATRESTEDIEDAPLSDRDEGGGDQEMPDANEPQGGADPASPGPGPVPVPNKTPEEAQLGDNQGKAGDEEPQESLEPLEPYQVVLQGFWTISQSLSAAYAATSAEVQILVQKSLAKTTADDRTLRMGSLRGHPPMDRLHQAGNGLFRGKHQGTNLTTGGSSAGRKGCPPDHP